MGLKRGNRISGCDSIADHFLCRDEYFIYTSSLYDTTLITYTTSSFDDKDS